MCFIFNKCLIQQSRYITETKLNNEVFYELHSTMTPVLSAYIGAHKMHGHIGKVNTQWNLVSPVNNGPQISVRIYSSVAAVKGFFK